jgi:hypothetical protein
MTDKLTPRHVAAILGISYESVLYHIKKTGLLKAGKSPKGWLVDRESIDNWTPPQRIPGRRGGPFGGGRPPTEDSLERGEYGLRSVYIGKDIDLETVTRIRKAVPPSIRGAILLKTAELAERGWLDSVLEFFEITEGT